METERQDILWCRGRGTQSQERELNLFLEEEGIESIDYRVESGEGGKDYNCAVGSWIIKRNFCLNQSQGKAAWPLWMEFRNLN